MAYHCVSAVHVVSRKRDDVINPAGIVESSSRRMGNRSKTLLKKGQCLGERSILEGEPAAESCTAGSPVLALTVNR